MNLRRYFIMGSQNCGDRKPEAILEEAAKAGISAFQFREKGKGALTGDDKWALGRRLRDICARYNILFFVNDDMELAKTLQADGVHVGQDDMNLDSARVMLPDKIVGLSVSNQNELRNSPVQQADYLGAGSVFTTSSKNDAEQAAGLEWIRHLRRQYPGMTIVGIGGITEENASSVIDAGADGVAVISAITEADNIEAAVRNL